MKQFFITYCHDYPSINGTKTLNLIISRKSEFLNVNIHLRIILFSYIKYYNEERIKEKLGWMSPIEYRLNDLDT